MEKQVVLGLSGLILSSKNPDRLASFYRELLGIPLALNSHGDFSQHWECDFDDVHFAIIEQGPSTGQTQPIVPSFHVKDIQAFCDSNGLALNYPVMRLDQFASVGETIDPDGNPIRLWMKTSN